MISQNIAQGPLNMGSILNNSKFLVKQADEKEWTQNSKKKKDQNNI